MHLLSTIHVPEHDVAVLAVDRTVKRKGKRGERRGIDIAAPHLAFATTTDTWAVLILWIASSNTTVVLDAVTCGIDESDGNKQAGHRMPMQMKHAFRMLGATIHSMKHARTVPSAPRK